MRLALRHHPLLWRAALLALAVAAAAWLLGQPPPSATLEGWCAGAVLWLVLTVRTMLAATPAALRRRAEEVDEGKWGVLAASVAAVLASLLAVAWHLVAAGRPAPFGTMALSLGTILVSWLFLHVLFATHYAHEYWIDGKGIDFPGGGQPDFIEFLYFAFTVGMTFQVSDATTSEPAMRRLVLLHGAVAFLFNAVILAAAVNLAATLA
ncbi:DUF1345 domain-containing protein [Siccirubricoccus sp. G192]|uniref:DUF1345 domain-containing protein n=1 Tax=Siccirubricoccus sp. G192 TaxID=2849651 RepID=UPI001C2BFD2E|nr:DUF1345 domain-containing protein [Siccirubricoccus sp. G192]MBV1795779.1 DUF1345 domain-containing protein [Siccirubricoccus sp. G192]